MSIEEQIRAAVYAAAKRRAAELEEACERALVGGVCGVSVYPNAIIVDPDVPYGRIHHHLTF